MNALAAIQEDLLILERINAATVAKNAITWKYGIAMVLAMVMRLSMNVLNVSVSNFPLFFFFFFFFFFKFVLQN